MKKSLISLSFAALLAAGPLVAGEDVDAELCLDCHEPAEDWEGMSMEDIFAAARDTGIKRHADNAELSDETLKAMIAELMAQ